MKRKKKIALLAGFAFLAGIVSSGRLSERRRCEQP